MFFFNQPAENIHDGFTPSCQSGCRKQCWQNAPDISSNKPRCNVPYCIPLGIGSRSITTGTLVTLLI
jgi:hypothetical protein